jgi:pimeloyl-ACP methyl ester carboxylesterase
LTRSLAAIIILLGSFAVTVVAQDDTPVIIIPGITGSELINRKTGEVVWFKAPRSKDDDLRLPVSANPLKVRDNLVPGDILRSVKFGIFPRIDVYDGLVKSLELKGGYHEDSWERPSASGAKRSIYVFPYDWRLDNVGNARLLIRKLEQLRVKLKRPSLKFNVIAHSMGGIIARYAAMYGDADLPALNAKPAATWAGAKYFGKIILMGTPNEGSALALKHLVNGFSISGLNINLPWIQNLSKFDLFTIPAAYQLLPAPGTFHVFDEKLEPLAVDLYDPKEWTKYGWNAIDDPKFAKHFTAIERRAARAYFSYSLGRARRLHEALLAVSKTNGSVEIDILGSQCADALDGIVVYREPKSDKWRTLFKPSGLTASDGVKVTPEQLKKVMITTGDGVVTTRSLRAETESKLSGTDSILRPATTDYVCEEHNRLGSNAEIQAKILAIFAGSKP